MRSALFTVLVLLPTCLFFMLRSPDLWLSPGNLKKGHEQLKNDCFACHVIFRGAPDHRCITCHRPADIGVLRTDGSRISSAGKSAASFHQALTGKTCAECHSAHKGAMGSASSAGFSHATLDPSQAGKCEACHEKPGDSLHQKGPQACFQCHNTAKWKPATFDHDDFFQLDRNHQPDCIVCHPGNDYAAYTCYGCHEHAQSKTERKHEKEGIRDFGNCTECHRNADDDDAKRRTRSLRGSKNGKSSRENGRHEKKDRKKKDHDDEHNDDDDDEHDDDDD